MACLNRRFAWVAVALPLLLVATTGIGRAAGTVTNCTTFGPGAGTLEAALTGGGTVTFACSGTIIVPAAIAIAIGTATVSATGQSVTLSGNNANTVFLVSSGATLNLTNLTIVHGSNVGDGGGIHNFGTLTVTNSTFSNNTAAAVGGAGGAIFNSDGGTAMVTNSTFSNNSAGQGGGIFNNGTLTVTNSTFSGNSAPEGEGGGVFNEATLTVTNGTFSGNSASFGGGGIFNNGGSATLKGTILAANGGGNCAGKPGPIIDDGFNIADDFTCVFTVPPIGTSINDSTTLNLDPLGLQNNGGPTQTIAIEPNSQALNFIPVADCTDQSSPPQALTTDQRGFPRPDSGNLSFCDAGAFELQTGQIVVAPGSERTQIARSTTSSDSDQINMAFTFTDDGNPTSPTCNAGTDALNGIHVSLFEGTCADLTTATGGLLLDLSPFVVHTVNHETYGTLFQSSPTVPSPETVSSRIVQLPTPASPACGEWTVNIEVAGLDTGAIGLGGGNPFALVVQDGNKNEGCFTINNAIVGNQIPTPVRKVRRGVRR